MWPNIWAKHTTKLKSHRQSWTETGTRPAKEDVEWTPPSWPLRQLRPPSSHPPRRLQPQRPGRASRPRRPQRPPPWHLWRSPEPPCTVKAPPISKTKQRRSATPSVAGATWASRVVHRWNLISERAPNNLCRCQHNPQSVPNIPSEMDTSNRTVPGANRDVRRSGVQWLSRHLAASWRSPSLANAPGKKMEQVYRTSPYASQVP